MALKRFSLTIFNYETKIRQTKENERENGNTNENNSAKKSNRSQHTPKDMHTNTLDYQNTKRVAMDANR